VGLLEGGRVLGNFSFFGKKMLVFSRDFENLAPISWIEGAKSVDSSIDSPASRIASL
jgi:hypothetical protein